MNSNSVYRQFQMPTDKVHQEIEKINAYLSKFLWMDFDYQHIGEDKIILCGCMDQSWREEYIQITFDFPVWFSSPFTWQMDVKKPFVKLIGTAEFYDRTNFNLEERSYCFSLNDESCETDRIFIAACGISGNFLKPAP